MPHALPPGFAIRPPRPGDGNAIVEMMNEETLRLRGVAMVDLDWIVNPWTAPGVDRENDFAVVTDPAGEVRPMSSSRAIRPIPRCSAWAPSPWLITGAESGRRSSRRPSGAR